MIDKQNPFGRLRSFGELLAFLRNGAIVGAVASILLFWNSPHQAGEIALAIVLPLCIFNCLPFLLRGGFVTLSRLIPRTPQESLPFKPSAAETKAIPLQYRLITYALLAMIGSFIAGLTIWLASFTYSSFDIPWAIYPARHLADALMGISVLPVVAFLSFLMGAYCHGKFRSLPWVSRKIITIGDLLAH